MVKHIDVNCNEFTKKSRKILEGLPEQNYEQWHKDSSFSIPLKLLLKKKNEHHIRSKQNHNCTKIRKKD